MTLLLAILSVLAAWAFLAALVIGLLLIYKPLEGVRTSLEQVAMGVRAIEKQTAPVGSSVEQLAGAADRTSVRLAGASEQLARVVHDLDEATPALRLRR